MSQSSSDVILVGGEALFDLVLEDDGRLTGHPGGGPYNTARTIGRLEQPVSYLGRLSTDRFGERLRDGLAADGVRLDCVVSTDDPTTLAVAEIGAAGARYRFYTEGTSAPGLTTEIALAVAPPAVSILHIGTLGLMLEPSGGALEAVAHELAGRALIALDPNIRPAVIADADRYRARLRRLLAVTDVVKVSDEDLEWLDAAAKPIAAARALLAEGPAVVLVTRGAAGAVVVTADAEVAVPAPPARVVDTIGAGDAFGGGFLAWWRARGLAADDLRNVDAVVAAARFACVVAARTVARAGADPPRRADIAPDWR